MNSNTQHTHSRPKLVILSGDPSVPVARQKRIEAVAETQATAIPPQLLYYFVEQLFYSHVFQPAEPKWKRPLSSW